MFFILHPTPHNESWINLLHKISIVHFTELKMIKPEAFLKIIWIFLSGYHLDWLQASPPLPPPHPPCLRFGSGSPSASACGRWGTPAARSGRRGKPPERSCRTEGAPPPRRLPAHSFCRFSLRGKQDCKCKCVADLTSSQAHVGEPMKRLSSGRRYAVKNDFTFEELI